MLVLLSMTIDFIVRSIFLLFNKYRRGQIKLPIIIDAIKAAINEFYYEELKKFRDTNKDVILEPLKPYVVTTPVVLTVNSTYGTATATLPAATYSGTQQTNATAFVKGITFVTDNGYEGTILQPGEWADRMYSLIIPPTNEFPIAKVENLTIFVKPASINRINLTYFRLPVDFVYATTTDADGRGFAFNAGGSTDTELNPSYVFEIVKRAAIILGIPYQNPDLDNLPSVKQ